jgi:hypothetical protein
MSDTTVANLVTGAVTIVTMLIGLLSLWLRLRYDVRNVAKKVDANTAMTSAGVKVAASAAKAAKEVAVEAKNTVEGISKKLNGGLEETISAIVSPVRTTLEAHDQNLEEVKQKFDGLSIYVHQRNHDMLNAMQTLTTQLALLLRKQGATDASTAPPPSKDEGHL